MQALFQRTARSVCKGAVVKLLRKYAMYLVRWQLSTPILAVCVVTLAVLGTTWATVIANLVGGLVFFWVDRLIFSKTDILRGEIWEIKDGVKCVECGSHCRGYRLVRLKGYDKSEDKHPEYRCASCSTEKYEEVVIKHGLR